MTESETVSSTPAKAPELKNSHWCTHPTHGLGMIGEIGAQASFHRFVTAKDSGERVLESTPVFVELADLTLCTPDQLPAHLGYTAQQLVDLGYAR